MYNQRNYANIKYPAKGYENATIATSGCAPTCMAMLISNLTSTKLSVAESANIALKCGARVSGGTDMNILAKEISKLYNLPYSTSNLFNDVRKCIENGGVAIVNVAGGSKGIFSNTGHYIIAYGIKGDKV